MKRASPSPSARAASFMRWWFSRPCHLPVSRRCSNSSAAATRSAAVNAQCPAESTYVCRSRSALPAFLTTRSYSSCCATVEIWSPMLTSVTTGTSRFPSNSMPFSKRSTAAGSASILGAASTWARSSASDSPASLYSFSTTRRASGASFRNWSAYTIPVFHDGLPPTSASMLRRLLIACPMYGSPSPERAPYQPAWYASTSRGSGRGADDEYAGSWPIAAASAMRARPSGVACASASRARQASTDPFTSAGMSTTGREPSGSSRFESTKTVSSFWFHCETEPDRPPHIETTPSISDG